MTTYEVTFEVEVPDGTSDEDFNEWIKFRLGASCEMKLNSLSDKDLEAKRQFLNFRKL